MFLVKEQKIPPKRKNKPEYEIWIYCIKKERREGILDLLNLYDGESCWRGRLKKAEKKFVSMFVTGGGEEEKGAKKEIGEWARYKYIKAI